MKKVLATLIIIALIIGVYQIYFKKSKNEEAYSTNTQIGEIKISGWGGFETEKGTKLSLITDEGEKIISFGFDYTVEIAVTPEYSDKIFSIYAFVNVSGYDFISGRPIGERVFTTMTNELNFAIRHEEDIEVFLQSFQFDKTKNTTILFRIIVQVKVKIVDGGDTKFINAVVPKTLLLDWTPDKGAETPELSFDYKRGFQDGYKDGWNDGFEDGKKGLPAKYTEHSDGVGMTYKDGYEDGYIEGYLAGYKVGYAVFKLLDANSYLLSVMSEEDNGEEYDPLILILIIAVLLSIVNLLLWRRGFWRRRKIKV